MALIPTVPGLAVRPVENSQERLAARRLHARCYIEAGYVTQAEVTNDGTIDDRWVPFSDYFVAIDEDSNDLVGTCRIIRPSVCGFPSFTYFSPTTLALEVFADLDPSRCSEISALATPRKGLQNMAISAALYGLVWRECVRDRRAYMLAVMDDRLLRIMRRWFEFPFEAIGEPILFMGARTTPVAMFIPRTIEHLRAVNPDTLRYFSADLPFSELDAVAIDIRADIREHHSNVIDLRTEQTAYP